MRHGSALGLRELIGLARALSPAILILDEATANLDFLTELSLESALSVRALQNRRRLPDGRPSPGSRSSNN